MTGSKSRTARLVGGPGDQRTVEVEAGDWPPTIGWNATDYELADKRTGTYRPVSLLDRLQSSGR